MALPGTPQFYTPVPDTHDERQIGVIPSKGMKRRLLLFRYILTNSYPFLRQTLKNSVKHLLGRKPYHDPRLVFFGQYILHLARIKPLRAITGEIGPSYAALEGPGSQAFFLMSTIAAARAAGLTYLHTPFTSIAHADRPMPQWVAAWEQVFNLGAGEAAANAAKHGLIKNTYNLEYLDLCFGFRHQRERWNDGFKALIPEFRRKYYLNKSPRATREVTVAVNIRRREVSASENSKMYTSNGKILRIAGAVKRMLAAQGVPFRISVYAQGNSADFAELSPLGADFFLDADPIWTIEELVEADILIVARSCFSYYAGLISDGIKIFEPGARPIVDNIFCQPFEWDLFAELDDWLACDEDGVIDCGAFERRLSLLLQAKGNALDAAGPGAFQPR